MVLVNVSPVDYASLLLVPQLDKGLPQVLDKHAIGLAIALQLAMSSTTQNFRMGFNGLGGFASVNHMHFQGYFFLEHGLPGQGQRGLPVEAAKTSLLSSTASHSIAELKGYPVPGLVFSTALSMAADDEAREVFSRAVMACVQHLLDANIPHNLLLSPHREGNKPGFRIFVLPQRSFVRTDPYEIGPAFPEISGFMIVKREEEFRAMDEAAAERILARVALRPTQFAAIRAKCGAL